VLAWPKQVSHAISRSIILRLGGKLQRIALAAIPFAALRAKEVPTGDVNGAGQPGDRIGHRMDDIVTEGLASFADSALAPTASSLPPWPLGTRRQKMLSSRPV
jgi:hypothetical protein